MYNWWIISEFEKELDEDEIKLEIWFLNLLSERTDSLRDCLHVTTAKAATALDCVATLWMLSRGGGGVTLIWNVVLTCLGEPRQGSNNNQGTISNWNSPHDRFIKARFGSSVSSPKPSVYLKTLKNVNRFSAVQIQNLWQELKVQTKNTWLYRRVSHILGKFWRTLTHNQSK